MRISPIGRTRLHSALFLSACLFLLVACGSNTSTSAASAPSGAAETATACAQIPRQATFRTVVGTLTSINGQTLALTTMQQKNMTVTYSSTTLFTQEVKLAADQLQEGTQVRAAVTRSGNAYTATSVLVNTANTGGTGGFTFPRANGTPGARRGGGNNPCFANRGRQGNATPGTGNNAAFRGIVGTVSQVNSSLLVITDNTGASYSLTLNAQTQIVATKSATSAALKVGEPLTIIGKPANQGAVTASSIAILLALPARASTPTA